MELQHGGTSAAKIVPARADTPGASIAKRAVTAANWWRILRNRSSLSPQAYLQRPPEYNFQGDLVLRFHP